jgi:hypothetical protein
MKTRLVRADDVRIGDHLWSDNAELAILHIRDAADGHVVLTLRPAMGRSTELKLPPWAPLAVVGE